MIPLLDFTDLPRTPAALAGTIVGNQLRFWRGAMTLMGAMPAAQMALAREAMAATSSATGVKTALTPSASKTVAKPAPVKAASPARRKATRKPARPAQSAAVKTVKKSAPAPVTTREAAAPKDTKAADTPTRATAGQSGCSSQRATSGGSALRIASADVFASTRNELVGLQVTGTLTEPKVGYTVLQNTRNTLNELLSGRPRGEE